MNKLELGKQLNAGKTHSTAKSVNLFDNFDDFSQSLAHFKAVATKSPRFCETSFEDKFAGQKMDNIQSVQPANAVHDGSLDQSTNKKEPGELALASAHVNSQTASPCTQNDKSSRPDKNLKKLRAAEARRRHELLEEERELQDNLAEFWDSRFDKPRRRRVGMTPLDAHTRDTPSPER